MKCLQKESNQSLILKILLEEIDKIIVDNYSSECETDNVYESNERNHNKQRARESMNG